MFFESDNISFEILTVQKIKRKNVDCQSYPRTYNALSFRIKGEAEFSSAGEDLKINENDIVFVPPKPQYSQRTKGEEIYAVHFVCDMPLPDKLKKFSPKIPNTLIFNFPNFFQCG